MELPSIESVRTVRAPVVVAVLLVAVSLTGCYPFLEWSQDQSRTWRVPADSSDVVWSRARRFLATEGSLTMDSEDVLQSERRRYTGSCGFTVTRTTVGDSVEFEIVSALGSDPSSSLNCRGEFLLTVRDATTRQQWDANH